MLKLSIVIKDVRAGEYKYNLIFTMRLQENTFRQKYICSLKSRRTKRKHHTSLKHNYDKIWHICNKLFCEVII
jgi:hypothetical protein